MAWIELLDPDDAEGATAAAFDQGRDAYGTVLETWKAVARVDGAFPPYLAYLRSVVGPGRVDARVKDLTAIRVGWLNGCRYTVSHRVASARQQGVSDEEILAVATPESAGFDEPTAAALAFADELTLQPPQTPATAVPQGVSSATLRRVEAAYDDAARAELALNVSLWNALARFHRVMDLDLDMPPPPPALDPLGG